MIKAIRSLSVVLSAMLFLCLACIAAAQERPIDRSEVPAFPENPSEHWPTYHLLHPGPRVSMPADPNHAFYYKGRYHLHYLYHSEEGGLALAHVSSPDMVHWEFHPTVLRPKNLGHDILSGTGFFTKEGVPAIIYSNNSTVMLLFAEDDDLDTWSEPRPILPKNAEGEVVKGNVWDPDCWLVGDTYYVIGGGKNPDLKKSTDLKNWEYLGDLMHEDFPKDLGITPDEDLSCPNMFKIGDKWMLLCISHALGCRYYIGEFKDEKFLPESHELMNWQDVDLPHEDIFRSLGTYFAPESLETPDGRRVMWAWLFPTNDNLQHGVQSLPRELQLPDDGILRIKPIRELEALRYEQSSKSDILVQNQAPHQLEGMSGEAIEFKIVFDPLENTYEVNKDAALHIPQSFGMNVLCDDKGENGVRIAVTPAQKALSIGEVVSPLNVPVDEETVLRVFIDKGIIEVFANDVQAMAYAHKRDHEYANHQLFADQGNMPVKSVTAWKMKSAWTK